LVKSGTGINSLETPLSTGVSFFTDEGGSAMSEKIPVAVLGCTGSVGQRFVQLLDRHPWFEVTALAGSDRSIGRPYGEVCNWVLNEPMPDWAPEMVVAPISPEKLPVRIVFSALPSSIARQVEAEFARQGMAVCSNASAYRREPDVPLLLPEVNPQHIGLIPAQRRQRNWKGCILTNPNCTSTGFTVALKALQGAFGLRRAFVVSLQALSGAGYPGVASLDILDNVIPNISGEEEKVEWEPRKMLGSLQGETLSLETVQISAHTNRVAVSDGHMLCVSLELEREASVEQAGQAFLDYQAPELSRSLPSAPQPVIRLTCQEDRPQPRLDRMAGKGMTTVIGQLRPDPLFHLKFSVLSHNTIRGAAGGSIYNAELLVDQGLL
jgi:aspartate-semialdehyde dehydrogenase